MGEETKTQKSVEKKDRISDLPDPLIHHIISFIPSTKQAIRTGILSKRWRNQWTQIPALIFHSSGMSHENLLNFIDKTLILHNSSMINTFHLQYDRPLYEGYKIDPLFDEKIRFATTRQVADLSLSCAGCKDECFLPEFLFNYASLVKLSTKNCSLNPSGKLNWGNLKELKLVKCRLYIRGIEYILSGSPLLELFELIDCVNNDEHKLELTDYENDDENDDEYKATKLVITSDSLKKLVLEILEICIMEISCPNLEELSITRLTMDDPLLFDQAIESALFNSSLLESFMLHECHSLNKPVIASQSLRRLNMSNVRCIDGFELSCPMLEEMKIWGIIKIMNVNLGNVPSSLCASLHFAINHESTVKTRKSFVEDILQQLQHVKELTIGNSIIEILTNFEVGGLPSPMLHIKCLTFDRPYKYTHLSRIACFLRNLPILETLGVRLFLDDPYDDDGPKLDGFGENYWSSNEIGFDCLVSHLKKVKIYGIPQGDNKPTRMLNFIQFILNNARVLENMTVVLKAMHRISHTEFTFEACQELLGFARCSEHATVELISECP